MVRTRCRVCLGTPAACGESQQLKHYGLRYCIMAALLTAVSAELQEVRHTASTSGEITLEGCPDHVSWKDAPFANELEPDVPTYVYWLRALFTPKETTTLVRTLMPASFSTAADSTDLLPSYEVYLLGAGKPADALQHDAARLARALSCCLGSSSASYRLCGVSLAARSAFRASASRVATSPPSGPRFSRIATLSRV